MFPAERTGCQRQPVRVITGASLAVLAWMPLRAARRVMDVDLKEILNTAVPTASLIFAAWIFLQLVNMRLQSALDRCQTLADEFRRGQAQPARQKSIREQIALYRDRTRLLQRTMVVSMSAAIVLILTLTCATLAMLIPSLHALKLITIVCSLLGLALLIVSVGFMLVENAGLPKALRVEMDDIPGLGHYE
jgi:hypothetical protein